MTIPLNADHHPQAATYNSPLGQYSTVVGGNMTLTITYIELVQRALPCLEASSRATSMVAWAT